MPEPADLDTQLTDTTAGWSTAVDAPAAGDLPGWYRRLAAAHREMAGTYEALAARAAAEGWADREVLYRDRATYHVCATRRAERAADTRTV